LIPYQFGGFEQPGEGSIFGINPAQGHVRGRLNVVFAQVLESEKCRTDLDILAAELARRLAAKGVPGDSDFPMVVDLAEETDAILQKTNTRAGVAAERIASMIVPRTYSNIDMEFGSRPASSVAVRIRRAVAASEAVFFRLMQAVQPRPKTYDPGLVPESVLENPAFLPLLCAYRLAGTSYPNHTPFLYSRSNGRTPILVYRPLALDFLARWTVRSLPPDVLLRLPIFSLGSSLPVPDRREPNPQLNPVLVGYTASELLSPVPVNLKDRARKYLVKTFLPKRANVLALPAEAWSDGNGTVHALPLAHLATRSHYTFAHMRSKKTGKDAAEIILADPDLLRAGPEDGSESLLAHQLAGCTGLTEPGTRTLKDTRTGETPFYWALLTGLPLLPGDPACIFDGSNVNPLTGPCSEIDLFEAPSHDYKIPAPAKWLRPLWNSSLARNGAHGLTYIEALAEGLSQITITRHLSRKTADQIAKRVVDTHADVLFDPDQLDAPFSRPGEQACRFGEGEAENGAGTFEVQSRPVSSNAEALRMAAIRSPALGMALLDWLLVRPALWMIPVKVCLGHKVQTVCLMDMILGSTRPHNRTERFEKGMEGEGERYLRRVGEVLAAGPGGWSAWRKSARGGPGAALRMAEPWKALDRELCARGALRAEECLDDYEPIL
jgi:hypothetical protein